MSAISRPNCRRVSAHVRASISLRLDVAVPKQPSLSLSPSSVVLGGFFPGVTFNRIMRCVSSPRVSPRHALPRFACFCKENPFLHIGYCETTTAATAAVADGGGIHCRNPDVRSGFSGCWGFSASSERFRKRSRETKALHSGGVRWLRSLRFGGLGAVSNFFGIFLEALDRFIEQVGQVQQKVSMLDSAVERAFLPALKHSTLRAGVV